MPGANCAERFGEGWAELCGDLRVFLLKRTEALAPFALCDTGFSYIRAYNLARARESSPCRKGESREEHGETPIDTGRVVAGRREGAAVTPNAVAVAAWDSQAARSFAH